MLVLTRKIGEQISVPCCDVTIEVLQIAGSRVRLGVSAPPQTIVHRSEVLERLTLSEGLEPGVADAPADEPNRVGRGVWQWKSAR